MASSVSSAATSLKSANHDFELVKKDFGICGYENAHKMKAVLKAFNENLELYYNPETRKFVVFNSRDLSAWNIAAIIANNLSQYGQLQPLVDSNYDSKNNKIIIFKSVTHEEADEISDREKIRDLNKKLEQQMLAQHQPKK